MLKSTASADSFGLPINSNAQGAQASMYSQAARSLHLCSCIQICHGQQSLDHAAEGRRPSLQWLPLNKSIF